MQAVIELIVAVMSALTLAILAQFGADIGPGPDAKSENVVARSPSATPQRAASCPQAPPPSVIAV